MIRRLLGLPSAVADYTVGTVIVLVQLTLQRNMKPIRETRALN